MLLIQEAVIDKLRASAPLKAAMGLSPSASGQIYEDQAFTVRDISYPRVNVGVSSDMPMNAEQIGGALAGKQHHKVYLDVHVFDNKSTSKRAGTIDQVIREALEGAEFSYGGLSICYCEMDSVVLKERDIETAIWHYLTRYALIGRVT